METRMKKKPWIEANDYLNDIERSLIAEAALTHLSHAPGKIRGRARQAFNKKIKVRGFRKIDRAPKDRVLP